MIRSHTLINFLSIMCELMHISSITPVTTQPPSLAVTERQSVSLKVRLKIGGGDTCLALIDGVLVAITGEGRELPILGVVGGGMARLFCFCGVPGKESIAVTRDEMLFKFRFGTVSMQDRK